MRYTPENSNGGSDKCDGILMDSPIGCVARLSQALQSPQNSVGRDPLPLEFSHARRRARPL